MPKMRKFEGSVRTDKVGSKSNFSFEIEDDASDDEIDEAAQEAMFQRIEWDFDEVTDA